MTTRHRRNAFEQAEDALNKLLAKQEAIVAEDQKRLDVSKAQADITREALARLRQPLLLGMDAVAETESAMAPSESAASPEDVPVDDGIGAAWGSGGVVERKTGGVDASGNVLVVVSDYGSGSAGAPPFPFHPRPSPPSACPHPRTIKEKDGRRVCAECGARVFETR